MKTTEPITPSTEENTVQPQATLSNSKVINQHYLITKILRDTPKGSVFKCFYLKGILKSGMCILKSGKRGASMDNWGRDMRDKLKWQEELHRKLQYLVPLPRLLDAFEYRDDYYIAISYINGLSLSKKVHEVGRDFQKQLQMGNKKAIAVLSYLINITEILSRLHHNGYVHRDVTVENFIITKSGKVYIIDMELTYSMKDAMPDPPHKLGTYGYMSPEQLMGTRPTVKEDIFGLGALLFKVLTGIDPNKVVGGPAEELQHKAQFFVTDAILAQLIASCLMPDPKYRPEIREIKNVLEMYRLDITRGRKRPILSPGDNLTEESYITTIIQRTINCMASPLMVKEELWFSERMDMEASQEATLNIAHYPCFSRGVMGVFYLLGICKRAGYDISNHNSIIDNSIDFVVNILQNSFNDLPPGLHFGRAGIAATITLGMDMQLLKPEFDHKKWIIKLLKDDPEELGFMNGIAGIGMAVLMCSAYLPSEDVERKLFQYVNHIIEGQRKSGSWQRINSRGKPEVNIGFAHGSSGIIWFLFDYYEQFGNSDVLKAAETGLKYIIRRSKKRNNGRIDWKSDKENEMDYWWCEGAPGIAMAFLKAYKVTKKQVYKMYATMALNTHESHIVNNNLTQCHGLAGLGEIYLEAYAILNEPEWRERALWIVKALIELKKEHPIYGSYWLLQKKLYPVADFMIGNAGIIHFLVRYLKPREISFPLLRSC